MAELLTVAQAKGEKRANVVFIHGLDGDIRKTWRAEPREIAFWPAWLAEDVEGLSIYSVGYEAPKSDWDGSAMHLVDRATNVLERLLVEPGLQAGPLIFVGHSLGGLVIKQLLDSAQSKGRNRADARNLLDRVDKVAFLATPHTGAGLANLADKLRIVARPSQATVSLERNDPHLRDLNHSYRDWANGGRIPHLVLTETKPWHGLDLIVKPDSADPGLAVQKIVPVDCDHENICKPKDRDSDVYLHALDFILRQVGRPREVQDWIDQLPPEIAAQIVNRMDQGGEIAKAADQGIQREAIIKFAERLKPNEVLKSDQAVKGLENSVEVALEVIAEGARSSNQDPFISDVLQTVAETTKTGRLAAGAAAIDQALAELDRQEEEQRAALRRSRETLLKAGVKQDILRRDAVAVARRIEAIAALDATGGHPAWSPKYEERLRAFSAEGEEKGVNFSLEVAIELARRMLAAARDADQRGAALNWLGNSLSTLGARESGTARLEEAVAAFRAALQEFTRARVPLQWAMTQNNLGTALRTLGERESGTARLEEAVAAFRAALEERTRDRVPLQWAMTQNNLGVALATLGERESGTARLEEAVAAFRAALEERTRDRVPLQWAMTQINLGNALSSARRARERHGAARRGRRLSRGAAGIYPRARPAPMGHDPDESRHCALCARRARERHGAARRCAWHGHWIGGGSPLRGELVATASRRQLHAGSAVERRL